MSKTITSKRGIAKAFADLHADDRVEITFKPIDDPIWFISEDGEENHADAKGEGIWTSSTADIIRGRPHVYIVQSFDGQCTKLQSATRSDWMWVTREHIAGLHVLPSPTKHEIDGMTYAIVLHHEGHAVVGCQTITRKGLQQIHDLLSKHLAATTG
jgi:hypothetical protein